jgi:hypothetical protein
MEYLIRWDQGFEPDIGDEYSRIWRPNSFPSEIVDCDAPYCIEVLGCRFSFSAEPPGLQIVVEGKCSMTEDQICLVVEEIRDNIVAATGVEASVHRISGDSIGSF